MLDEVMIQAVHKIASTRRQREYPMLGGIDVHTVRFVCEAMYDLSEMIYEKQADNFPQPPGPSGVHLIIQDLQGKLE